MIDTTLPTGVTPQARDSWARACEHGNVVSVTVLTSTPATGARTSKARLCILSTLSSSALPVFRRVDAATRPMPIDHASARTREGGALGEVVAERPSVAEHVEGAGGGEPYPDECVCELAGPVRWKVRRHERQRDPATEAGSADSAKVKVRIAREHDPFGRDQSRPVETEPGDSGQVAPSGLTSRRNSTTTRGRLYLVRPRG